MLFDCKEHISCNKLCCDSALKLLYTLNTMAFQVECMDWMSLISYNSVYCSEKNKYASTNQNLMYLKFTIMNFTKNEFCVDHKVLIAVKYLFCVDNTCKTLYTVTYDIDKFVTTFLALIY